MKASEQHHKTTGANKSTMKASEQHHITTRSTKRKAVTGLSCNKSATLVNKAPRQRRKTAGNALVSQESEQSGQLKTSNAACNQRGLDELPSKSFLPKGSHDKEISGQPLAFPSQAIPPAVPEFVPRQSPQCLQKFKLQLFPIDECTRKVLEMDKHNPYLELTLGTRKKISSVVKHLNAKWGSLKMASGELMLFPYHARLENIASHRRWTLEDSDITVADVHAVIGSPATFRLRYGWLVTSKENCRMPLLPLHSNGSMQSKENQKNNIADKEKHPHSSASEDHGLACASGSFQNQKKNIADKEKHPHSPGSEEHDLARAGGSFHQGIDKPSLLDKPVQATDNLRTGSNSEFPWDLSNISFSALLSGASVYGDANPISCDSFDAAFARLQAAHQATPMRHSSIWDAEETCSAFSFPKTTSLNKPVPAQSADALTTSVSQNVSPNPLRLHDAAEHTKDDACEEPTCSLQLHLKVEMCSPSTAISQPQTVDVGEEQKMQLSAEATHSDSNQYGKLDALWPESLGPWECAAPSSKQMIGSDSIGLSGLFANSLDAFQTFSI